MWHTHVVKVSSFRPCFLPLWSEGITPKASSRFEQESPSTSSGSEQESPSTAVGDLVNSLTKQRVYCEVTLVLCSGMRDVCVEFLFLGFRKLHHLLKFLRSIVETNSTINLFSQTQSLYELQVVPVLFQHLLKDSGNEIWITFRHPAVENHEPFNLF